MKEEICGKLSALPLRIVKKSLDRRCLEVVR